MSDDMILVRMVFHGVSVLQSHAGEAASAPPALPIPHPVLTLIFFVDSIAAAVFGSVIIRTPFLKLADSRRSIKKKFEPTVFAMIDKSWQLFFARAILCAESALFTNS